MLELVELVYASVDEPSRWDDFLALLTDVSHGASMVFFRQDVSRAGAVVPMSVRIGEDFRKSYESHYNAVNPWMTLRPELLVPGRIATSEEMCPTPVLRSSEFFNDWLAPQGYAHCLGGVILRDGPLNSVITAFRTSGAGPASAADIRVFKEILPHLQRGVQLYFRLLDLETGRSASEAALEHLATGVVLVDGRGRAIFVNRAARRILDQADGLTLTRDGLRAARADDNSTLARLVRGAVQRTNAASDSATGDAGGAMALSRPSRRRRLSILVSPLHCGHYRLGATIAAAAVFVSDPEHAPESDVEVLRRVHDLTRAEAALAVSLMAGRTVHEAADELGISTGTARIQLKQVFAKTGVHRQTDLVRLLLGTPARGAIR